MRFPFAGAITPGSGMTLAGLAASDASGKGAMPPKAGNAALKDDEIKIADAAMLAAAR